MKIIITLCCLVSNDKKQQCVEVQYRRFFFLQSIFNTELIKSENVALENVTGGLFVAKLDMAKQLSLSCFSGALGMAGNEACGKSWLASLLTCS